MLPRQFGKIILTLENCLLSDNKLQETPSQQDGLDKEIETDLRILGCELIQIAGILLKLPQVAMATGQVLFQRFYYSKSYLRHNMEITAMSCICLASKIEEAPRRIRDVINVFHHIKQVRGQKTIAPMILDTSYIVLKTQVIKAERRVLKELGFCVHVKHPHKLIVMYLQVLGYEQNQRLMQMAWNFMNDSLRTDVFVRFNPESIACACIYLTARKINLPLPNNPTWFGVFNVKENDILDISYKIMELYRRPKPNAEILEQAVEKRRNFFEEIRSKNKTGQNTPPMLVTVSRNEGSHNAWGGFVSRAFPLNAEKLSSTKESSLQTTNPSNQNIQPSSQQYGQNEIHDSNKKNMVLSRDNSMKSRSKSPQVYKKTQKARSRSRSPEKHRGSGRKRSRNYSRSDSLTPIRHIKRGNQDSTQRTDKKQRDYHSRHDHRSHQERFRDRK